MMRGKVIYRIACGTCAVCITYSLISQAFRGGDAVQTAAAEWAVTPIPIMAAEPTPTPTESTYPFTYSERYSGRKNGKNRGQRGSSGSASGMGGYSGRGVWGVDHSQVTQQNEEEEKKTAANQEQENSTSTQQTQTSGDPPTLAQFLSAMRCGGCRHNCCLLSPRCMKGKTKMQNATVQYQQTYGG